MDQEVPRTTSPTPPPPPPPPPPTTDSPPLSPTSSSLANSRWTPTKEQIAVLEGLYTQGLRTPNAEQIQQITARLREHGHIEGKNVFYWFQNHKARQRQKQKQQSFAYFSRLFRRPPSMPPPVLARPPPPPPAFPVRLPRPPPVPTCNNVIYRPPCYIPAPQAAANAAYYAQPQRPVFPRMEMAHDQRPAPPPTTMEQTALGYANAPRPSHRPANGDGDTATVGSLETLQLFPLQPTFVLPDETRRSGSGYLTSSASASSGSEESESPEGREHGERPQFFDFFGVHSGRP